MLDSLSRSFEEGCQRGELTSKNTTTAPNSAQRASKGITSVSSHGRLGDLERLSQSGDLEHVETGPKQQIAELDRLLLWHRGLGDCEGHRCRLFVMRALTKGDLDGGIEGEVVF
jgi:hypothetical protein